MTLHGQKSNRQMHILSKRLILPAGSVVAFPNAAGPGPTLLIAFTLHVYVVSGENPSSATFDLAVGYNMSIIILPYLTDLQKSW